MTASLAHVLLPSSRIYLDFLKKTFCHPAPFELFFLQFSKAKKKLVQFRLKFYAIYIMGNSLDDFLEFLTKESIFLENFLLMVSILMFLSVY